MTIIRPSLTLEAKLGINKLRKTESQKFEELLSGNQPTKKVYKDPLLKKPAVSKGKQESNMVQNVGQRFPCPICGEMRNNLKSHLSKVHKAQTVKPSKFAKPNPKMK